MVDYDVFGLNAPAFHFTNLLIHLINTCLVFELLRRRHISPMPAGLCATLWACHPLQVESVAWVSERKGLLAAMFCLMLLVTMHGPGRKPTTIVRQAAWYSLSLASKPAFLLAPLAVAGHRGWRNIGRKWRYAICFIVPATLTVGMSLFAEFRIGALDGNLEHFQPRRLLDPVMNLGWYLQKAAIPFGIPVYRPYRDALGNRDIFLAGVGSLAILATVLTWKQLPGNSRFGLLSFFLLILPSLGFLRIGAHSTAAKYAYLPLVGLVVFTYALLAYRTNRRAWTSAAAVAVLIAYSVQTRRQLGYWETPEGLWRHTLSCERPGNYVAENNLGSLLLGAGHYDEALEYFDRALRWRNNDPVLHYNKGLALFRLDSLSAARDSFARVLDYRPSEPRALRQIALVQAKLGDMRQAISFAKKAVVADPWSREGYDTLERLYLESDQPGKARSILGIRTINIGTE
ncbi:MAG: tetratricopeptide repeat protein [Verrucomicrobiae bacterium]|nr:tetratricopeptide repeat protein [Verrucomicrobiae bacterium]